MIPDWLWCRLGWHDNVKNYENLKYRCARCGRTKPVPTILVEMTNEKLEGYKNGDIDRWELDFFITYMYDEGYDDFVEHEFRHEQEDFDGYD